jgi:signal transduction histidine kinase
MSDWLSRTLARTPLGGAVLAFCCVAAALGLTLAIQQIAPRVSFILFLPAVMVSAWFGGRVAGLLASVLTVFAAVLVLPRTEIADQLVWIVVATIVVFGTSAATTARRRVEDRLIVDSQLKTDLLAQVAHELRQPISAIGMAVRLVEAAADDDARTRAAGVIARQAEQLRHLVDDLLDLSRMTRQELQLRKSPIDLCQIVDDSIHGVANDAAARGVELAAMLPACPLPVTADPTRVRQILSNLLSNAVKFTPAGGRIDVEVDQTPSEAVIRVRDTGRGIPAERLPRIFEMFHKGDGEGSGLGVGLAVVKGLAEMHGGSVEARSAGPGHGAEFVVTLPAAAERPAA